MERAVESARHTQSKRIADLQLCSGPWQALAILLLCQALPRLKAESTYSWYQCIQRCNPQYDACDYEANWRVTSCHFKNVCVNTETHNIHYFRDQAGEDASVHTDEFYNHEGFPSPLAYMAGGNTAPAPEDEQKYTIDVDVDFKSFQEGSLNAVMLPGPVVYMSPFTPDNFGHCLADNAFPAYRLLRRFGLSQQPATFVFKGYDINAECVAQSRSCKNIESIFKPTLTKGPMYSLGSGALQTNATKYACAQDLVVGFGKLGMYSDSDLWDQFNVRLLKAQGIPPAYVPKKHKHKILIFKKNGRRAMTNVRQVAAHLRDVLNVRVQVVDIAKLPLAKQAKLVSTATVLISPCGGLSFSSVFLPKGTSAIFVCTYNPEAGLQLQIERFWYDRQSRFQAFYYPVEESEVTINTTFVVKGAGADHELTPNNLYRNFADITVSLPKMIKVVHSALHMVELGLGWNLSYTIPPSQPRLTLSVTPTHPEQQPMAASTAQPNPQLKVVQPKPAVTQPMSQPEEDDSDYDL